MWRQQRLRRCPQLLHAVVGKAGTIEVMWQGPFCQPQGNLMESDDVYILEVLLVVGEYSTCDTESLVFLSLV